MTLSMTCRLRASGFALILVGCLVWAVFMRAAEALPSQPASQAERRSGADSVTVVIGSAAPLSGPLAAYGEDNTDGVRMAIDDLNKQDIVIGGKKVIWRIDAQDDRADPDQAVRVAREFVDAHVNGVVGHLDSASTAAAAPIYFEAGIPEITPSSSDPAIAQQGFSTFYRIIANDYAIGAGVALYAEKGLKAKTAIVIDDGGLYGRSVAHAFERVARQGGLQILERDTLGVSGDTAAMLGKIKAAHPDVVFFGGMAAQAASLLRQMRDMGIRAHFLGGDGICTPAFSKLAGSAADSDVVCADGGVPVSRMPGGEAWKQRFVAEFGAHVFQLYSPYAYDATMVLAHAMMKADSTDPRVYAPFIRNLGYDGVTKTDIRFNRDGELVDPSITISSFPQGRKTALSH